MPVGIQGLVRPASICNIAIVSTYRAFTPRCSGNNSLIFLWGTGALTQCQSDASSGADPSPWKQMAHD